MKKALIVVDMLNDFIWADGALYCGPTADAIVPNVLGRIVEYRKAGLPIFFLADNHAADDKEFKKFPPHCVKGTEGAQIIDVLKFGDSENDFFMPKTRYSGFYGTHLAATMLSQGLDPTESVIEVCGVCTSICVMDTVGDLANRDYATVVHRNCVADFDPEMHEMALKRMAALYGATII